MGFKEFVDRITKTPMGEDVFNKELNIDSLGTYLISNKKIMNERNKIHSLLKDLMPHEKLKCNLLMVGFDADILFLVDKSLTNEVLFKLKNKLEMEYGVTPQNAEWIIVTWLSVIFKKELPKLNISDNNSADNWREFINYSNSPSISEVNKTVPMQLNRVDQPNNSFSCTTREMIKVISDKSVFESSRRYSVYTGKYIVNDYDDITIDEESRNIYIQLVTKGQACPEDILHLSIDDEFNFGWAITYDSFYIMFLNKIARIKYDDIKTITYTEKTYHSHSGYSSYEVILKTPVMKISFKTNQNDIYIFFEEDALNEYALVNHVYFWLDPYFNIDTIDRFIRAIAKVI